GKDQGIAGVDPLYVEAINEATARASLNTQVVEQMMIGYAADFWKAFARDRRRLFRALSSNGVKPLCDDMMQNLGPTGAIVPESLVTTRGSTSCPVREKFVTLHCDLWHNPSLHEEGVPQMGKSAQSSRARLRAPSQMGLSRSG